MSNDWTNGLKGSGRPYRSKWSWRKKVVVKAINYILAYPNGIALMGSGNGIIPWDSIECDLLAVEDYIYPPTGPALCDVLEKLNGQFSIAGSKFQIIRW